MPLPFTVEQFFALFHTYNTAVWPAQLAAYGLGALSAVLMLRRNATADSAAGKDWLDGRAESTIGRRAGP